MRLGERGRPEVLRRMRDNARTDVSVMWNAECAVGEVLWGMRDGARDNHSTSGGYFRTKRASG